MIEFLASNGHHYFPPKPQFNALDGSELWLGCWLRQGPEPGDSELLSLVEVAERLPEQVEQAKQLHAEALNQAFDVLGRQVQLASQLGRGDDLDRFYLASDAVKRTAALCESMHLQLRELPLVLAFRDQLS